MKKKTIIYCDDQERFRTKFTQEHKSHYDIIPVENVGELLNCIEAYKNLPDLVLLDLYHPRDGETDNAEKVRLAEESLTKLDLQIEETKHAVENAWEPTGLEVLKLIRSKYSAQKLPVVIYTQKGLILMDDKDLREAEINGADWLIKKKLSPATEQVAIDRIIMRTPAKISTNMEKVYRWVLAFSWLLVGLLGSRLIFSTTQFTDISIAVVVGIVSALASYLVSPMLTKVGEK